VGGESATVASSVPDYQLVRQYLSTSLLYRLPLGLLFGADRRTFQVGTVVYTEVQGVSDHLHHVHVKQVDLGGEAAPKYLSKIHPRFEEMLRLLTISVETRELVWCILQGSTIVEITSLGCDESNALCQWIRQHAPDKKADATISRSD
jgi:hypothetical protein